MYSATAVVGQQAGGAAGSRLLLRMLHFVLLALVLALVLPAHCSLPPAFCCLCMMQAAGCRLHGRQGTRATGTRVTRARSRHS